jgi:type IV secretory pathway TraG/TraD family ATPase VirD4
MSTATGVPSRAWAVFGQVVAVIVAVAITAVARGLVLAILWGWFIQPLGVRSINVAEAIGLATIVGLLSQRAEDPDDDRSFAEKMLAAIFASLFGAGLALLVGYLAHLLV